MYVDRRTMIGVDFQKQPDSQYTSTTANQEYPSSPGTVGNELHEVENKTNLCDILSWKYDPNQEVLQTSKIHKLAGWNAEQTADNLPPSVLP